MDTPENNCSSRKESNYSARSESSSSWNVSNLKPIQFDDLKKALLEAENEPLCSNEDFQLTPADESVDELETSFIEDKSVEEIKVPKAEENVCGKERAEENICGKEKVDETEGYLEIKKDGVKNLLNTSFIEDSNSDISTSTNTINSLNSIKMSTSKTLDIEQLDQHKKFTNANKTKENTPASSSLKGNYYTPAKQQNSFRNFKTPSFSAMKTTPLNKKENFVTPQSKSCGKLMRIKEEYSGDKGGKIQYSIPSSSYKKTISFHEKHETQKNDVISKPKLAWSSASKKKNKDSKTTPISNKENSSSSNRSTKVKFSLPKKGLFEIDFKKLKVKDTQYIILSKLGQGGSSVVYHCFDPDSKCERAIKKVFLSDEQCEAYINEVNLLHTLQNCDKIVKMYDYEILENENVMYVVLEKGDTDLSRIIKNLIVETEHLPMYILIFYWMEMLYAVKQIHDKGIIHSDLKPANFLKAQGRLKLIDFGIASSVQGNNTSVINNISRGSFNYISPESLNNEGSDNVNSPSYGKAKYKISYKTDVWSLGCILYQLVYKKTPFQSITNHFAKFAAITNPKHQIQYPEANWVPPKIIETMKTCLRYEMRSRPSIDDLIKDYERFYY